MSDEQTILDSPVSVPTQNGLTELKTRLEPQKETPVRPVQSYEPGDSVISRAKSYFKPTQEDIYIRNLYQENEGLLKARLDSDPAYAEKTLPELQKLGPNEAFQKVLDLGDEIKIEALKQADPEHFTSSGAAIMGLMNTATFGQLSRIAGAIDGVVNDVPIEDAIARHAETVRLYQKAFPKSNIAGNIAGYLVPGSPAKALFQKFASLGLKSSSLVTPLISKISNNPKLLTALMQSGAQGAAGGAAGGFVSGTLGKDFQDISFDRGVEDAGWGLAIGGGIGVGIGAALRPAQTYRAATAPIKKFINVLNEQAGKTAESTTGVPERALRASGKYQKEITAHFGTRPAIADDVVDFLQGPKSKVIESQQAREMLPFLDDVDPSPVVKILRRITKNANPERDPVVSKIRDWANRIETEYLPKVEGKVQVGTGQAGEPIYETVTQTAQGAKIPATKARDLLDIMQGAIDDEFSNVGSSEYYRVLKGAARTLRMQILQSANPETAEGYLYRTLMDRAAQKTSLVVRLQKQLGRNTDNWQAKAETLLDQMFGKNKALAKDIMSQIDDAYGTDFVARSQLVKWGEQLGGNQGKPALMPVQQTGAASKAGWAGAKIGSTIGTVLGTAAGGASGAVKGAVIGGGIGGGIAQVIASPRVAVQVLGSSGKISGFLNAVIDAPEALAAVAGRSPIGKNINVPTPIRDVAKEIYGTLLKDGPVSAGSTMRLVADTPYFFGLVHYFDKAQRAAEAATSGKIMAREYQRRETEIANKP